MPVVGPPVVAIWCLEACLFIELIERLALALPTAVVPMALVELTVSVCSLEN